MNITILYDSFFGNTKMVAEHIGRTLEWIGKVEVLDVKQIDLQRFLIPDLLIVGSPTRGFRPSPATIEFLNQLPDHALEGKFVAAFDTRMALAHIKSRLFRFVVKTGGFAAKTIEKKLKNKGGMAIAPPEGFEVMDVEGPLLEGELKKVFSWAKNFQRKIVALTH